MASSANRERIEAVDERGTSRSEFDARGRLLRLQDADGGVIEYSYDAVGNLLERRSPSQTLLYRYDARNRLIEVERRVQGEAPALTRYSYDAAGRRSTMEGGDGTRTEYAYDSRHRLRGLVKRSALGALLMGMGYQVDADGLRTQISESDATGVVRTVQYDYDAVKRLVAERIDHRIDPQDRRASWSYDRVGNRLRQSVSEAGAAAEVIDYTYDTNDRLQSERGASIADYTYDAAGNLLSHGTPGGITEYVYNDAGRMREARSAGEVNAYVYNADGLRVRSTRAQGADSETTWILQDPSFEYAQSLEHWRSQNAGPRRVSAVFSFGDELLSQTRFDASGAPSTVWLQTDGFGSTRAATDASGSVIDQIDYDAYGNEIARSGSTAIEHLYRGEAFDPNVGFYYLRARWMDPRVGRFTQQDAFAGFGSDPMSLHKYLYAHVNPVMNSDPSGYMTLAEIQTSTNIQALLGVIRTTGAGQVRSAAFRRLGQIAQDGVAKLAKEVMEEIAEEVLIDSLISFSDRPGDNERFDRRKRRVIDFSAAVGDLFADFEVKYGIPRRGLEAMERLISQVRSMRRGPNASRVLIIMSDNVTDAAIERLRRSLRGGRVGPVEVLNGSVEVTAFLGAFFLRQ